MAEGLPDFKAMSPEQLEAIAEGAFSGNKGLNLGPFLLAGLFDVCLYGIMTQQYMTWWQFSRPNDRAATKWLTHYIFIASTAWSIGIIAYEMGKFVYTTLTFLKSVGRPPSRSSATQCLAEGAITVALVILIQWKYKLTTELEAGVVLTEVRTWQCVTLGTDFVITISLAWGLYRSKTGWSNTDALVKKLILLTLETQLAPTLVMLAFVTEFSIVPSSTIGIFFDLRRDLQGQSSGGRDRSNEVKTNNYALGSNRLQQATVQVDTQTYIEEYSLPETRLGVNRSFGKGDDIREIDEAESVEQLDYAENLSKQNLHGKTGHNF
ncbi:hypothetical protein I316_01134 [Kwoniella heveanensis BCC8398]|uniref:DUF6534 domain-containing protein n=1 Tax=Kwoniella heveanensis BCC8398 TaxID=1296120 RepID=A0A1B9H1U8_9TREE|nr:hypothetical protein I316_01134 [Kwoniella heveanensis BCC8398]